MFAPARPSRVPAGASRIQAPVQLHRSSSTRFAGVWGRRVPVPLRFPRSQLEAGSAVTAGSHLLVCLNRCLGETLRVRVGRLQGTAPKSDWC